MNLLWWLRKHKIERSSKEGEDLTDYERNLISKTGKCPDCGGGLLEGPRGGMSTNYCCSSCHSEFNLTIIGNAVLGEWISDRGPREIGDRGE
ncbi:MAG TPA: hypothetical protein VIH42_03335 [Thermoguttaceae bacterium]